MYKEFCRVDQFSLTNYPVDHCPLPSNYISKFFALKVDIMLLIGTSSGPIESFEKQIQIARDVVNSLFDLTKNDDGSLRIGLIEFSSSQKLVCRRANFYKQIQKYLGSTSQKRHRSRWTIATITTYSIYEWQNQHFRCFRVGNCRTWCKWSKRSQ